MPRKWKNSDENTYYSDKAVDNRLEKLRCDLIVGYALKKNNKRYDKNNQRRGYIPKNR